MLIIVLIIGLAALGDCADNSWMLPYERSSIKDCKTRFFKNIEHINFLEYSFGGKKADVGEFAHIAAIGWTKQDGTVKWLCGGSLIWENFILTAAHCAADDSRPPMPPDVARMGDINIYSDHDDKYAQQLKIVKVIRHPKHRFGIRYYDIALMKLETYIRKSHFVHPICLWLNDEIPFPRLLAAGWGITGIGEDQSKVLLQVALSPVNNTECAKHHKGGGIALRNGIEDHQMCAVDPKMDLCPGDSGGPLLVNLISFFGRNSQFLVGITSFGKACGLSVPGVFVKVSKLSDWIFKKLQFHGELASPSLFEPFKCAEHSNIRPVTNGFIFKKYQYSNPEYIISLQWSEAPAPMRCSGALIEPNIVLTLAQCASYQGIQPDRVVFYDSTVMKISDAIVHPNYTEHAKYHNNIAVLRLESYASVEPACGWYDDYFPSSYIKLYGYNHYNKSITLPSWMTSNTDCNMVQKYASLFPNGLQDEHICFKDEYFLVPNSCDLQLGAPIQNKIKDNGDGNATKYNYVWGLNMLGQDCGFGIPAVGVRLSAHKEWLESVLLPRPQGNEAFVHIDPDLDVSDGCRYADGTKGTCAPQQNCAAIHIRLQSKQQVVFCKNNNVVCCPEIAANLQTTAIEKEFNECEERYAHLRSNQQNDTSHIVEIGWHEAEQKTYGCYGYLISTRGVVSSASCLLEQAELPNIVRLGGLGISNNPETIRIEKVEIHPRYNKTTQQNNIAIVKLASTVKPSEQAFPGCLWQNFTHSPVLQQVYDFNSSQYYFIHPLYQSDCDTLVDDRILLIPETTCMKPGWTVYAVHYVDHLVYTLHKHLEGLSEKSICFQSGSPVIWRNSTQNATYTEYLVHIYNYGECSPNAFRIVERVVMYIDWFKIALV